MNTADHPRSENERKPVTIYINTRPFSFDANEITFEQVVALAFPDAPQGENVSFSVLYHRGHGNHEGTLTASQAVKVKDGMRFDVTPTDRS